AFWWSSFHASWKTGRYWFLALLLAASYCYVSESAMVRLGTYYYDVLRTTDLGGFLQALGSPAIFDGLFPATCPPGNTSMRIPIGIALIEGVLMFSIIRTSSLLE